MAECLRALTTLATERPVGFGGAGPIPESKAYDWACRNGYDQESYRVLWLVLFRAERDRIQRENDERKATT